MERQRDLPLLLNAYLVKGRHLPFAGDSMLPLLRTGALISVRQLSTPPAVGDIVLFLANGALVVHRVIARNESSRTVVTRGDARVRCDAPVRMQDVLGHCDGLYDPSRGQTVPFGAFGRTWDALMRWLVGMGSRRVQPALLAGAAAGAAVRSFRVAQRLARRMSPGPQARRSPAG